jgi:hypothetical protein
MADIPVALGVHEFVYGLGVDDVPKRVIKASDNGFILFRHLNSFSPRTQKLKLSRGSKERQRDLLIKLRRPTGFFGDCSSVLS